MRMYTISMESEEEIMDKASRSIVSFSSTLFDTNEDTPDIKYEAKLYDDCSR